MEALVEFNTVSELFNNLIDYHQGKDQVVLRYVEKESKEWVDITWPEFRDRAQAMAGYLYAQGVRPGDRVAILSENRPEWAFADMATQLLGAKRFALYHAAFEGSQLHHS